MTGRTMTRGGPLHTPQHLLPQLRRVRWAVRLTLVLGVAASVAANVLHARPDPVAQIIAAWPPLALLLTVELISRVPVHRRVLAAARLVATTAIAGIAAWVSYWHMAGVASRYGEQGASPFLLPLSVDGLVIVASVSLVELAGRIRTADTATASATATATATGVGAATTVATDAVTGPPADQPPVASHIAPSVAGSTGPPVDARTASPGGALTDRQAGAGRVIVVEPAEFTAEAVETSAVGQNPARLPPEAVRLDDGHGGPDGPADGARAGVPPSRAPGHRLLGDRPPAEPKTAIAYWHAKDPTLKPGDIAARVGRSRSTVRRVLAELDRADATDPNGADVVGTASNGGRPSEHDVPVNGAASKLAESYLST
jgi:hypothetical protein